MTAAVLALFLAGCRGAPDDGKANADSVPARWSVSGRITVPADLEAAGILVYVEGTSHVAMTDRDGQWIINNMESGRYQFRSRREDLTPADLGPVVLEADVPGGDQRVLLPTVAMSARAEVVRETPPVSGSLRGVVRFAGNVDQFDGVVVQVAGTQLRTVTDALGQYFFSALSPGDCRLIFSRKGWKTTELQATVIVGAEMPGPIPLLQPEASAVQESPRVLKGIVEMTDLDGQPAVEFTDVLVSLEGTMYLAVLDSQGRFAFASLAPGRYTVMAAAPGFLLREKVEVDLTALEAAEITIHLDENPMEAQKRGGMVYGNVTYKTPPLPEDHSGILVALAGTSFVAVTDREGHYEIRDIPPGRYLLRAQAEAQTPQFIEPVEVEAGEETGLPPLVLAPFIAPPEVIYTEPADGSRNVTLLRDTPLTVRFSKKMRPETVKAALSITPPVAVQMFMGREHPRSDFDLLFVTMLGAPGIDNADPLRFATDYQVTIGTQATDFEGASLVEPYTFSFSTGEPQIISTRPGDGESNVYVSQTDPIFIEFNAPMNHDSMRVEDIRIRPEPQSQPAIQAFDDPVSGWTRLRIYVNLELDKEYQLTASGNWRAADGTRIANMPIRIRFKTAKFHEYRPDSGTRDRR
jgi:hypothetical protein